jgi:hypothetical protein
MLKPLTGLACFWPDDAAQRWMMTRASDPYPGRPEYMSLVAGTGESAINS